MGFLNRVLSAAEIKARIESLTGSNRLDASAIKNLPVGNNIRNPRGAYSGIATYSLYDEVTLNGSSYWWINSSSGNSSPPSSDWQLLAAKGDTGATGATGANGTGLTDGDKGDITVSSSGSVFTIDNLAVTFAKIQNIASGVLLGRSTAGSGSIESVTIGSGLSLSGGVLSATGGSGGGLTAWQIKSANYTAVAGDRLRIDCTSGDVVITLPATPSASDADIWIQRIDTTTNKVLLRTGASKIKSLSNQDGVFAPGANLDTIEAVSYVNASIGWLGQQGRLTYQAAPEASTVIMLLKVSNNQIVDLAGRVFTNNNCTIDNSTSSIRLTGSSWIQYAANSLFDLASLDFCLEWIYQHVSASQYSRIFGINTSDYPLTIYLGTSVSQNFIAGVDGAGGSGSFANTSSLSIGLPSTSSFLHGALTRQGNIFRTFRAGSLITTVTQSGAIGSSGTPQIGVNNGNFLNGYLLGLKLTINNPVYTANFTPPTSL